MAHPVCGRIGDALVAAGPASGMAPKRDGTYLVTTLIWWRTSGQSIRL
jgi:hypothetical protein